MGPKLIDVLKTSGNNLHMKVAMFLQESDWVVDINSYYLDDTSNKPREIDIIAWKKVWINNQGIYNSHEQDFKVFLFIECKYFREEIAFWMHKNDYDKTEKAIITEGMTPSTLYNIHHYLVKEAYNERKEIGKLYTNSSKDAGVDRDSVFNAITQPLKSLTFFKQHRKERGLYYPLCIYEGIPGIYEVNYPYDESSLEVLQPKKESLISLNYSYKPIDTRQPIQTQLFCIDFVHFDNIKKFTDIITSEFLVARRSIASQI